jgi:hypothetical protein
MTKSIFIGTFLGALGVALVAGASTASAQEVIIRDPALAPPATVVTPPLAAAPVETVETVRTVSTDIGPRRVSHRRVPRGRTARITTTRTITREIVPGPAVAVAPVAIAQPGYTPVAAPLYDVAPGAAIAVAPTYQYLYQPDRILVIDPATGIAVQSIPR